MNVLFMPAPPKTSQGVDSLTVCCYGWSSCINMTYSAYISLKQFLVIKAEQI